MFSSLEQTYDVVQTIQNTGMESVVEVRHKTENKVYQATIIPLYPDLISEDDESVSSTWRPAKEEFLARFKDDVEYSLGPLAHPHIARFREILFTPEHSVVTVMEQVEGPSLRTLHQEHQQNQQFLPIPRVLEITRQLLDAIAHLHHRGFAPPLLLPESIRVVQDRAGNDHIKIVDLALMRALWNRHQGSRPKMLAEEAAYASPEQQLNGDSVDGESDVRSTLYSLGVVLYELLTGVRPVISGSANGTSWAPQSFDQTDPEGRVPEGLRNLVLWTLEPEPQDRPQSVRQLEELLDSFERPPAQPQRKLMAAIFLLLGLGLGAYFLSKTDALVPKPATAPQKIADLEKQPGENPDSPPSEGPDTPPGEDPPVEPIDDPEELLVEGSETETLTESPIQLPEDPGAQAPDKTQLLGEPPTQPPNTQPTQTSIDPPAQLVLVTQLPGEDQQSLRTPTALQPIDPTIQPSVTPSAIQPDNAQPVASYAPLRDAESGLLLKMVGASDNTPILRTPGSSEFVNTMEPLRPYFVLEETGDSWRISSRQAEDKGLGFVQKDHVEKWNTREGLHFLGQTFNQNRRRSVTAWKSLETIESYLKTGDEKAYGPTFKEQFQTRIGNHGIIPYPLLDTKEIQGADGTIQRVHQVLIPAIVSPTAEIGMDTGEVKEVAGAVTFCVVFDATASMGKYARNFARTIDMMLSSIQVDSRLASAGFVLFRDLKDADPHEVVHPMALNEATDWLRDRAKNMVGGDKPKEPVLDAVALAQNSFLWNGGTAVRGAKRIAIVVANEDAYLETVGLDEKTQAGQKLDDLAGKLLRSSVPITVFSLQAGDVDRGNLVKVLSTLAEVTGGEFYGAARNREEISSEFSKRLGMIVSSRIEEGNLEAERIAANSEARQGGGTIIALNVLDKGMKARLQSTAAEFNIVDGGLLIESAWVREDPTLYREKILIDKDLLENLLRFFNGMNDTVFDTVALKETTENLLEALIGERLDEDLEVQELIEKRLGIHFTTNLLSFELEQLEAYSPEQREFLREGIRDATYALADFLEMNETRFAREPRIWMPVSYLP